MKRAGAKLSVIVVLALYVTSIYFSQPSSAIQWIGSKREHNGHNVAPIMFVQNVGQWNEKARFHVFGANMTNVWLTDNGSIWVSIQEPLSLSDSSAHNGPEYASSSILKDFRGTNIRISFPGANPHSTIETFYRMNTVISYFKGSDPGHWFPSVPVWGGVRYVDLYAGIDLEITSNDGQWIWRMFCKKDPCDKKLEKVRLQIDGAEEVSVVPNAYIQIVTQSGRVNIPFLTYESHRTVTIPAPYTTLSEDGVEIRFPFEDKVQKQKENRDTLTNNVSNQLKFSSFIGGYGGDAAVDITVDQAGNAYIVGETWSDNFPVTAGAFDTSFYNVDAFLMKVTASGDLAYATFLGGGQRDRAQTVRVTDSGEAYVGGFTLSSDFPATSNAYDKEFGGGTCNGAPCPDGVIVRMNRTGTSLIYSTFLGGRDRDDVLSLALDTNGYAYITGSTWSDDFPVTPNVVNTVLLREDAYVAALSPSGTSLLYSTLLGGSSIDRGLGIAVDSNGNVYVTGNTLSSDFPTTHGAFDREFDFGMCGNYPCTDAYVVKLTKNAESLSYATLLGGTGGDTGYDIAVDTLGYAYVSGYTTSPNFPTTHNSFDTSFNSSKCGDRYCTDAFVVKINKNGENLVYSTFLGGTNHDWVYGISIDRFGSAYVAGETMSSDFPVTDSAFSKQFRGGVCGRNPCTDGVIGVISPNGDELSYSSFIGGDNGDANRSISLSLYGDIYLAGETSSYNFPITDNAFGKQYGDGSSDAYLAILSIPVPDNRIYAINAVTEPSIDGSIEEWTGLPHFVLNTHTSDYRSGSAMYPDINDLSMKVFSAWNKDFVWFAFMVTDDNIVTDSANIWEDDEIELGLDGLNDREAHWFEDDHQYLFTPDGRVQDFNKPNPSELQYAIKQVAGGWNVEVRVPRSALGYADTALTAGKVIGLNLGLHDDDDGGNYDTHLIWSGSSTTNSQGYGQLVLSDTSFTFPSPEATPTPSATTLLRLEPANANIPAVSKESSVEVQINNVSNLGGFQFTLTYDPTVVHVESVSLGDFLASTGRSAFPLGPQIDNNEGKVTFGAYTLGSQSGASGSGLLATIVFSGQSAGDSALTLSPAQVTDVWGKEIPVTVQNGSIHVSSAPPAATATHTPTFTPTGTPTPTFTPTLTPTSTFTPIPTGTPTETSSPTPTPSATATDTPTITPTLTPTPAPEPETIVRISPGLLDLSLNVTGTISIKIQNVSDLGGFQFTLTYDPTVVHVEDVTPGSFLSSTGRTTSILSPDIDNQKGQVTFGAFSFGSNPGPTGSGTLAFVTLSPQATGTSPLVFQDVQVIDIYGTEVPVSLENNTVSVHTHLYVPFLEMREANTSTYEIVTKHSGKCLDVTGVRQDDGINVQQWACSGGPNQRWRLVGAGDGYYKIVAVHSGKCLNVSGGSQDNGANVIQWTCHGGPNQLWRLDRVGDAYRIVAKHSGKVLEVAGASPDNGANVQQWQYIGGLNQLWRLVRR